MSKKNIGGIELFRILAALLIVAIHTSPLMMINETADFILTRTIARVAVPFFFMVSGFFLFSEERLNASRLQRFVRKTAALYGIAILLYLPVNVYMGYFNQKHLLLNLLKDLIIDGTLYHLWYLPAAILGAVISYHLLKKFKLKGAFLISIFLYLIGLLGDSYYGVSEIFTPLKSFYSGIFLITDYTRNGLFFAPVFFLLGGRIARSRTRFTLPASLPASIFFLLLMLGEGLILHHFKLQRHDSMYLMLLPCMYFLFQAILCLKIQSRLPLRSAAMIIYLVHPFVIIILRVIAKSFQLESLIIYNSMIHYILVLFFSVLAAMALLNLQKIYDHFTNNTTSQNYTKDRAWVEINMDNLKHNVTALREIMPEFCEMMAIVKADAYGHGAIEVSSCLNKMGVKIFGVATIDEGISLRKQGVRGDILILGYTDPFRLEQVIQYKLIQTVLDYDYAKRLNSYAKPIQVHIKIDTGMHRIGIPSTEIDHITELFGFKMLKVCGIFTHLSVSDSKLEEDVLFTRQQLSVFYDLLHGLKQSGITLPKVHIQSSYGLLNYPELNCNYARIGIAMYGVFSSLGDNTKLHPVLRPVLSLKSRVVLIREIKEGETVSYGRTFMAKRNSRLALLPIGYADGLPRSLSCETGSVLLRGYRIPIVGRICMDQLLVDITDVPEVVLGDVVTLIGQDGKNEISAAEVATNAGSITNELLSRLGTRLERIYL